MKKLLLMMGAAPLVVAAQTPDFTLTGRIGHYNAPAKIYFDHMQGDTSRSDSAVLLDGKFRFSGKINGPAPVRMAFAPLGDGKEKAVYTGDVIYFYIGYEQIRIESNDSLENATISGSPVDLQYNAFNKYTGGPIMALTKAANADFNSGTDEQKKDTAYIHAVDKRFRQSVRDMETKELEYAKTHPSSWFSLVALSNLTNSATAATTNQQVFDALDMDLRNSFVGKELEQRMNALTSIQPGTMAPDFTENDVDNKPITLSSLRGKYVLIDFWASWCHPCRMENPHLLKQYQLYRDKGFQVLSVSLDDNIDKWKRAIAQDSLPWLHVSDLRGWNNAACKLYAVRGVPSSFLIDPQGKIIATGLVGEKLDEKLKQLFAN